MSNESEKSNDFIAVNQILNAKPQLGPIPGEQVIPWIVIIVASYIICYGILKLDWIAVVLVSGWGIGSWWVLTGNESWRFLSKFHKTPNWTRGYVTYNSLLEGKSQKPSRSRNSKLPKHKISNSRTKRVRP